ncbi:hypothetical protein Glove_220g7 [Diversispora epigaea]|uniref:F-box/LRR-repeat protein 15-like leucin rich repeat domain-containing protein n=1 Tax=Diversispora epigaea TaxID=1348612 RepID=A0A397IFC5_9GLOM|nr:hypothetical protein Glove_220g7 [Diversispora epigaea]
MIENFNDHAERKVKNEFKYLKACIIDLEYGMRMFHKKLENIVDQCNYMYSDNYERSSVSKTLDYNSNTSNSETELSDDVEILTYTSKDIPVKKIHESKDLGPVYSKSKKKRNKKKYKLLEQILYFLEIDRSLYSALFVNHLWYHCGAPILWYRIEFFNKDYRQNRHALNMSQVLTQRLINFKRVIRGKIKPLYCSKMAYLRLEGLKISDAFISAILHSCPNIRFLILDKSKGFSNIPIIEIAKFSPKLQHLSLNSCICLTNRCITEITRSCPKLRHLELGDCSIGNKAVEGIARNCTNLEYLSLDGCIGISEEVMKKLNPKIKIEYPDYSDDEFSDSDLPPLIPDPLRATRSVIFTDRQNGLVLTNTLRTDLINAIRVSSELTDSERINLLNSLARDIGQ